MPLRDTKSPSRQAEISRLLEVLKILIEGEFERVRECVRRDRPYGSEGWTAATARSLAFEYTPHPRGRRPKSAGEGSKSAPTPDDQVRH